MRRWATAAVSQTEEVAACALVTIATSDERNSSWLDVRETRTRRPMPACVAGTKAARPSLCASRSPRKEGNNANDSCLRLYYNFTLQTPLAKSYARVTIDENNNASGRFFLSSFSTRLGSLLKRRGMTCADVLPCPVTLTFDHDIR